MNIIKSFAQLLIVLLTPALLRAQQNLPEPTPVKKKGKAELIENADLQQYLQAHYVLVHELTKDAQAGKQSGVVVVLKNTDDKKAPLIGYIETDKNVSAAILKTASAVKMLPHPTDKKKVFVLFLDKQGDPFFRSVLEPFAEKK